ncbi:nucleotide exchange factor GrpE [Brevibacillus massiliensis]|uniref:nucleotide exchange factor GrpE n=1 Tax=Brevibacillus massiliensis TaxID=1118054 RepID=UPI0002D8AD90|nr:nucleotide exchange factor GrpE [Brevibacillus massiliensis]
MAEKEPTVEAQEEQIAEEKAEAQADEANQAAETAEEAAEQTDLASELQRYKALAEETQNRLLRAMADMDNMRRRMRKEQEDLAKYASMNLVEAMLPTLDNFERALSVDKESLTVDTLLEGVNMIYRQMVQLLEKEGLSPIESVGKPFDLNVHQAVMQVEDPEFESGVVVEELQKGYLFKDRVIRPAMVKVNA